MTTTAAPEALVSMLSRVDADVPDAERYDQLGLMEQVKSACAAAQARITLDFADSQEEVAVAYNERAWAAADVNDLHGWRQVRAEARQTTVATSDVAADRRTTHGRRSRRPGEAVRVAGEVALALRESPSQGSRHLTTAWPWYGKRPRTLAPSSPGCSASGGPP